MTLLTSIAMFVAGVLLLVKGADWLVEHAALLAEGLGVPRMAVGLTVVAFGTSAPELAAAVGASLRTNAENPLVNQLAIGAVVGSNIANIGLIMGVGALLAPIVSTRAARNKEMPLMLGIMAVGWGSLAFGMVERWEGALLFAGVILYTWTTYAASRGTDELPAEVLDNEQIEAELAKPRTAKWWLRHVGLVAAGIVGLTAGAEMLVRGSVSLAGMLGVPELVIGLTMVALGTSLPELATAISAARHRETELLLGNIIGSNVFNTLCVIGAAALIRPIVVPDSMLYIDGPVMMGVALIAWGMMLLRRRLKRIDGVVLLCFYAGYVTQVVLTADELPTP
jgi:cation:H+ antiporter